VVAVVLANHITVHVWHDHPVEGLVFFRGDTGENYHNAKLKFSTHPMLHYQFYCISNVIQFLENIHTSHPLKLRA
jgi:hypothetical protein